MSNNTIMKFGLIGKSIEHSFSPIYFNNKFKKQRISATYERLPLNDISEFDTKIDKNLFKGFNVTIPYKTQIISYLDRLSEGASRIGAVNTIAMEHNQLVGYNTDAIGFETSLLELIEDVQNIRGAIVLGNGGAAKAVFYILESLGIPYLIISRSGIHDYKWLNLHGFGDYNLIINTTPLGMFPHVDACPDIPYHTLNEKFFLFDLIYNPKESLFLSFGKQHGARTQNGLKMLEYQAEAAWTIWNRIE